MLDRGMSTPMDSHTKKAVQFLDAAFHYLLKHCRLPRKNIDQDF